MNKAPSYQPPPLDPLVTQAQDQAQSSLIAGLQTQSRSDTASLMAQYGALASAAGAGQPAPSTAVTGGLAPGVAGRAA